MFEREYEGAVKVCTAEYLGESDVKYWEYEELKKCGKRRGHKN